MEFTAENVEMVKIIDFQLITNLCCMQCESKIERATWAI